MTKSIKFIRSLLSSYKENDIIADERILELLTHHPTKKIERKNIEYVKLKPRPPFGNLSLYYKLIDNEEDDISWVVCIRNLYGKYDEVKMKKCDIQSAFRNAIYKGTRFTYLKENTKLIDGEFIGICENCKKEYKNIDVDHYQISFKSLLEDFLIDEEIALGDVKIKEIDNRYNIVDESLLDRWRIYHDKRAKYRLLCKSCNSHFGCYKLIDDMSKLSIKKD